MYQSLFCITCISHHTLQFAKLAFPILWTVFLTFLWISLILLKFLILDIVWSKDAINHRGLVEVLSFSSCLPSPTFLLSISMTQLFHLQTILSLVTHAPKYEICIWVLCMMSMRIKNIDNYCRYWVKYFKWVDYKSDTNYSHLNELHIMQPNSNIHNSNAC